MHQPLNGTRPLCQIPSPAPCRKLLREAGLTILPALQRNLHKWAQFPPPGKLLSTLSNPPGSPGVSRGAVRHHLLHPASQVCRSVAALRAPCSEAWFSESMVFPCVWHRPGVKMCLPNGTVEAAKPILFTPTGPPAGKGCLSPSRVARMTSRACPPQGVGAELLPQLILGSSFWGARGGRYPEGVPSFRGWLRDA